MRTVLQTALAAVCVVLNISSASADELTLDQAVTAALERSPLVAELDSSLAVRQREARDVSILPNPELDAEYQAYTGGARGATDDQPTLGLTQPFRLSHLGGLRERVAALKEEAATSGREAELVQMLQRVRLAFAHLWVLGHRKTSLRETIDRTVRVSAFIERGFREAALGKGERELFRAETARLEAELDGLEGEIARANRELLAVTGVSGRDKVLLRPAIVEPKPVLLERFAEGSLAVQKRLDLLVKVSAEELRLAERDSFPELRPRIIYAHTNDGGNFVGAGITMQLPIWNRNQNAIHAAVSARRSAEAVRTFSTGDDFKEQLVEFRNSIASGIRQLTTYETKVIPGFRAAHIAYEEQLKAGQGNVQSVWQSLSSLNESSVRFSTLWAQTYGELAELNLLIQEDA